MKRVLIAGMHHESNSFNPIIAGEKDFSVIYGDDIFNYLRPNDATSGIIRTLQEAGYDVIPTVFARAVPNGEVDQNFYYRIKEEIINRGKKAHLEAPLDAITLSIHGSMRISGLGEAEGDLLEALKQEFPETPIYASLDMHTTMTERMHNYCDGFVGYKCAPHTDCTETGVHAARMTIFALENDKALKSAWVKVPIIIAGEQSATAVEPMVSLIKALREVEKKQGILAASYLMGFPWADNEDSSIAVYVVSEEDQELADQEALALAELIWSERYRFTFHTETYSVDEALDVAFEGVKQGPLPIYISDSGDNPTAGAASDCTQMLKKLMDDSRTEALSMPILYGGIYDPEATRACKGKVGEKVTLTFGAKFDPMTSDPITATGTVKSYLEGWGGQIFPKGDLALFHVSGVDIVFAEQHVGYTLPDMFEDLGVDPRRVEIVVCKLGYLTEQHEKVAKRSIMALTKGNTNEDLKSIPFKKVKRPLFPLDDPFEYDSKENLIKKEEK
ncbi:M81 family metallopeptidase [Alkaliphilus peptidifermentans]|uniref:Microcystin degradation protein MlrC, contains DUF1485 domain n=1 Tax=Alkaliphilus peptidifermentans DSM 18978 TaxID=1120976 RepID=A0A1G5ISI5_9FIRM|nr:M81 family metallopeptidase [Alkaliphilus peptidifermentans]SCY78711.1 Microcystin degradation protein MlrC, contains DUF1485 domain [Alkaliphilus peptidifermentans DSM 18978]